MRNERRIGGLLAATCLAACGGKASQEEEQEPVPVAIETIAPESVRAGESIPVMCVLLGADGAEIVPEVEPSYQLLFAPEEATELTDDGETIATRAGQIEVSCSAPELVLVDTTQAQILVEPGDPAQLVTTLDRDVMTAGETVQASCEALDAWGNRVEEIDPSLRTVPAAEEGQIEGLSATLTGAGAYEVVCDMPGVETFGAELEVLPGLPASLVISRVPSRPVYARGEIIEIAYLVADQYENRIPDAAVLVESQPSADMKSGNLFRYLQNGIYQLTATVQGPTLDDQPLSRSVEVLVDGSGPDITCESPADGGIVHHTPGASIALEGSAADLSGVTEVVVNGTPVSVDASGDFSTSIPTHFGINFVNLSAVDENGDESTRVCSFLLANRWAEEGDPLPGGVSMKLRQSAIDDGNRSGALGSLGDMFHTMINSAGLKDQIHEMLLDANPIKPSSCDVGGPFGTCLLRTRMDYLDSNFAGTNSVYLDLVSGGLRGQLTLRDVRLKMEISGTVDTTGWVIADWATIDVTFDAWLQSGQPKIAIRPGTVSTTVGPIDPNFSGFSGWIIDAIVFFAEDYVRDLLADEISDLIQDQLGAVLDDLVAGLDISSLNTFFSVPRIGGGGSILMFFSPGFSHLSATSSRLLFGLSTRFSAAAAHARPSLGAPVENPPGPLSPSVSTSSAVAIHSGVLVQALHALWRAGLFDATLADDDLGGSFPDGASVTLTTGLPPVARIVSSSRVELSLGNVGLSLSYPTLFPEPVVMTLGMRASMRFSRNGDDIEFDDFQLEELHFTSEQVSIDTQSQETLEEFFAAVLGRIVGDALNDAFPALPIPSFDLPASLSDYGLPAGASLGLSSPALSVTIPQFVLAGALRIQ